MSLKRIINNRWFAIFDLGCVSTAILLWELNPNLGGWPLLVALFPWLARLSVGLFPFRRTPFDLLLTIFLLSAAVGTWVAYNPANAWAKLWLLVGGIILFYSVVGQPQNNQWLIAWLIILFGVGTVCFFLLSNDWQQNPNEIGLLNQAGLLWQKVRPTLNVGTTNHNSVAGVVVYISPFLIPIGFHTLSERHIFQFTWLIGSVFFLVIGFLLAISRGAVLALGTSICFGILSILYNRKKKHNIQSSEYEDRSWIDLTGCHSINFVYYSLRRPKRI